MTNVVTQADQDVARLDIALAERLGEPVDPRVRAIAEKDRTKKLLKQHGSSDRIQ